VALGHQGEPGQQEVVATQWRDSTAATAMKAYFSPDRSK